MSQAPKRPCGCRTHADDLDPRHIIHYDSSKTPPKRDKQKEREAFALLEKAREKHLVCIEEKDTKCLDTQVRQMYKEAAIAFAYAGDITGAVIADSMDSLIDFDVEMMEEE